MIKSTLQPGQAAGRRWPVIVAGAGVAGAVVAHGLARRGVEVLLLEKRSHPRRKVCGGCLHPRGFAALEEMGLAGVPSLRDAGSLDAVVLSRAGRGAVRVPLGGEACFRAVDRAALDADLVDAAIGAGAQYIDRAQVLSSEVWDDGRRVAVRCEGRDLSLDADLVVSCEGLTGVLARGAGLVVPARPLWREKVGFSIEATGDVGVDLSAIAMLCEPWGYLGIVGMGAGRWHLAAAIRPEVLSGLGGAVAAARTALARHGLAGLSVEEESLSTSPTLTRVLRRRWAPRLLVAGDAAGYLEPITGEGMTWAIASASAVTEVSAFGWSEKVGPVYEALWQTRVAGMRRLVSLSALALDRPAARGAALWALGASPVLRAWVGGLATRQVPR